MSIQDRNPVHLTPSTVRALWSSRRKESENRAHVAPHPHTYCKSHETRGCLGVNLQGVFNLVLNDSCRNELMVFFFFF